MTAAVFNLPLMRRLRLRWKQQRIRDQSLAFILEPPPPGEWVSLDCETTGLNTRTDDIISIGAVRIVGDRVMTSQRFDVHVRPEHGQTFQKGSVRIHRLREQDVADGLPPQEAVRQLLHFIGARPLVGYFLEFDVAMVNRIARPLLGFGLPHEKIEVSALYYDHRFRQLPPYQQHDNADIDLRFDTLMADLNLPRREAHDALNDAVMAALAFIKLRNLRDA